jgi:uncharacterized protein Yka (UPF0111/DUF47 family)
MAVTTDGMAAFARWAHGDRDAAAAVRELEHRADDHKRSLRLQLTEAFATPLEPEDLFALSRGLDALLNGAKDAVREAEVMALPPDEPTAAMIDLLADGVRHLSDAFALLGGRDTSALTAAADAAVKSQRRLERAYRAAMSALLENDDLREVMARREMYRRLARLGDGLEEVAERVWYSVLKEA